MKTPAMLLTLALVAACSPTGKGPADDVANTPAPAVPAEPATAPAPSAASTASATGVVESIDSIAKTITISHGPVDALKWPAMTMNFKAADVDLTSIKKGDQVSFEFTSTGMDGTITSLTRQ